MAHLASLLGGLRPGARDAEQGGADLRDAGDELWVSRMRVAETYNDRATSAWTDAFVDAMPSRSKPRVSLAVGTDLNQWKYRYMFEKKGERSLELDNRLDEMGEVIRQAFNLPGELEDPSVSSQSSIYSVGRICERLDHAVGEDTSAQRGGAGRLSQATLTLETSRMVGNGQRVPLTIDPSCRVRYAWRDDASANIVGLFPGMIVGVKGRNGSGNRFVAEELLMPPALPHPASARAELREQQYGADRLAGSPLRFMTAAGPFTDATDLEFRPWHSFMHMVEQARPDVVILLGPFVSANHPLIAAGEVDELPEAIFHRHIGRRITRLLERSPATLPILVPSTDDVFHAHHAYPQPFIDKSDTALGLPKRARCLPNPCVFYINELAIGISTADVLGDLRREELVQRVTAAEPRRDGTPSAPDTRDPMSRLSRHVLCQRSFYPLFPPSAASMLPLDLSHSSLCALDQVTPDMLLLPSTRVRPYLRVVDSTIVVNPGSLAGGAPAGPADGTPAATSAPNAPAFVRIQVDPMPQDALEGDEGELVTHDLYNRARIELVQQQ